MKDILVGTLFTLLLTLARFSNTYQVEKEGEWFLCYHADDKEAMHADAAPKHPMLRFHPNGSRTFQDRSYIFFD